MNNEHKPRYGVVVLNYPSVGVNCWCHGVSYAGNFTDDINAAFRQIERWNVNTLGNVYVVKEFDESKVEKRDSFNIYKE